MARGQARMQTTVRATCNFPVHGLPAHGQICRMRRVTRSRLASLNNFFDWQSEGVHLTSLIYLGV
jgi:hypothetical protein